MSGIIVRWSAYGDNSILNLTRRTRGGFTLSWRLQNSTSERVNDAKNTSDKWKTKEEVVSSDGFIHEKDKTRKIDGQNMIYPGIWLIYILKK